MGTLQDILDEKPLGLVSVEGGTTVWAAVSEMCRIGIGSLLVGDSDAPVGIISERDIMAKVVLGQLNPTETTVAEIMTSGLRSVPASMDPEEAMCLMTDRRCRHLPVTRGERVIGIVSIGDLVRWVTRRHEYEIRALQDYVSGVYMA